MELFWLEHKKLWRKKIVKICVLLCFVSVSYTHLTLPTKA